MREFGDDALPAAGEEAVALALVLDGDRVLVIDDGVHFTLPGGPVDGEAEAESTLAERVLTATGHAVVDSTLFQRAVLHPVEAGAPRRVCAFYRVEIGERTSRPLPHDSMARWAPQDAALDLLGDDASRWALSVALAADAIVAGLGGAGG